MAFVKGKGTILEQDIASTMTPVAQVVSLNGPNEQAETAEFDTFDNTSRGIPKKPTGRADGGVWNFEVFHDGELASHQALMARVEAPASAAYLVTLTDGGDDITFNGILKGPNLTVELSSGVMCAWSIEVDGAANWQTS